MDFTWALRFVSASGRFLAGRVLMPSTMPKVLVIDDEASIRTLLVMPLRHQGMTCSPQRMARWAWSGIDWNAPMWLCLNMPEPDGVTALKEIRSVDLNQSVNHVDGRQHPDNRAAHP